MIDGFDNSGDVLSVPPLLLEKYFDLAEVSQFRAYFPRIATHTKKTSQP